MGKHVHPERTKLLQRHLRVRPLFEHHMVSMRSSQLQNRRKSVRRSVLFLQWKCHANFNRTSESKPWFLLPRRMTPTKPIDHEATNAIKSDGSNPADPTRFTLSRSRCVGICSSRPSESHVSMETTQSSSRISNRLRTVTVILAVFLAAFVVLSAYFYAQYENQVSVNSQNSQFERGFSKAAEFNCEYVNQQNSDPAPQSFTPLLKSQGNATGVTLYLISYWPVPFNSTHFQLYEVWKVGYGVNGDFSHLSYVNMTWSVFCPLVSS